MRIFKVLLFVFLSINVVNAGINIQADQALTAEAFKLLKIFIGSEKSTDVEHTPYLKYYEDGSLKLGTPLNVNFLDETFLNSDQTPESIGNNRIESDIWLFPVLLNGNYVSILTLRLNGRQWEPISYGRAQFSKEIENISKLWPNEPIELFERPLTGDSFFSLPKHGNDNLTPITYDDPNDKNESAIIDKSIKYRDLQKTYGTINNYKMKYISKFKN